MRAGSARKNPYDGIIQSIGKCTRRRKGNSVHQCSKSKGVKRAGEQFQSHVIDGESELQWNYQEPSSPQQKRSSDPRNEDVVKAGAMEVEPNGDNAVIWVSNNSMREANQGVVSSKEKCPTRDGEGYTACRNGNIQAFGYGSDCSEEGERRKPVGWYLRNTKGERTELSQSDEDQMMQLSQESIARERAHIERSLSPAAFDVDGTPPKRRKQQNSEIRKRPRCAPYSNPLARDNFEFRQPESEPPVEENYIVEPRSNERMKETGDRKTEASRVPDGQEDRRYPEVLRDAKMGRTSDISLEENHVMEETELLDRNRVEEHVSSPESLKKIVITVRCTCPSKCKHKTSQAKRNRRFGGFVHDRSNLRASSLKTSVLQNTTNGILGRGTNHVRGDNLCEGVPKRIRHTAGNRMQVDGLPQGEVGFLDSQALNSSDDESRAREPPLPAGEDGYSLSSEGVHIGLQVRQQLLGHSKGTQNDFSLDMPELKYFPSQDTADSATTQEKQDFEPNYEGASGGKQRCSPGKTRVAQSTGQVTDMKANLQGARAEKQSLLSPTQIKRRKRRMKKKVRDRKEPLPEERTVATQNGSGKKGESAGSERFTHAPAPQTPIELKPLGRQAKTNSKKNGKNVRDAHSGEFGRQGKVKTGTSNDLDVPHMLDDKVQECVPYPLATGTEVESSKTDKPEGSEIKNLDHHSLNHSERPETSNTNEEGSLGGANSPSLESVVVRIEQSSVTDEENRGGDVHAPARKKSYIPQQHEGDLQQEALVKSELDECIVDVDNCEVQAEKVKALRTNEKAKRENLDDLVDQKELTKQSALLLRRSRRLRNSRMESARAETSTRALDELSDNEASTCKASRSTPSSRSRGRSGTTQADRVRSEQTYPIMTRRRSSRYADTLRGGAPVIDLTDAADEGESGNTSRAAEGDDDINESLKELQKLSLQDRAKAFHERPRCKYLTPLSNDEDRLAKHLFTKTKVGTRIVAIAEAGITLKGESFKRLRGTRWLDDEVLNAYVSLINSRNDTIFHELSEENRSGIPRTFVFNTYFFTRLCSGSSGFDYPGVQGWTKRAKVDITQKDIILVPINLGNHHWVLSGIDMVHQEILYLDSMHGPDTAKAMSKLKRWVFEELRSKHGEAMALQRDPSSWKELRHSYRVRRIGVLPESLEHREAKAGRVAKVPKQHDGGSCGVFTAKMADCLSMGIKVYFKQGDIPLIRRRMALDLFRGYVPL